MDDLMGRIQEMLSDEESMKQIQELADMLSLSETQPSQQNNTNNDNNTSKKSDNTSSGNNNSGFDIGGIDIGMIFKLQQLMSSAKTDRNTELIMALKPHLSAEKQIKADKAVKFLKLFSLLETLKESGMLNDLDKMI